MNRRAFMGWLMTRLSAVGAYLWGFTRLARPSGTKTKPIRIPLKNGVWSHVIIWRTNTNEFEITVDGIDWDGNRLESGPGVYFNYSTFHLWVPPELSDSAPPPGV